MVTKAPFEPFVMRPAPVDASPEVLRRWTIEQFSALSAYIAQLEARVDALENP